MLKYPSRSDSSTLPGFQNAVLSERRGEAPFQEGAPSRVVLKGLAAIVTRSIYFLPIYLFIGCQPQALKIHRARKRALHAGPGLELEERGVLPPEPAHSSTSPVRLILKGRVRIGLLWWNSLSLANVWEEAATTLSFCHSTNIC